MSVVFSIFDFRDGSIPVYTTVDADVAKKVALKSQLTLSMVHEQKIEDSEAVIPFPDLNQLGYVYLFKVPGTHERAEEHVASLTYLVDSSKRMDLYREISLLRHQAITIANYIRNNHVYEKDKPLPLNIQDLIQSWGYLLENAEISLEEHYIKRKITIKRSEAEPSIPFLFNNIKKPQELERLITGLYLSKPIFLVSSSKVVLNLCMTTLEEFVPHKTLRKISYTEDPVLKESADIIGISRNLMGIYGEEIIVDLDNGRVFNGERSTFVEKMLREIKNEKQQNAIKIIIDQVMWLLKNVSQLTEAFTIIEEEKECEKVIQKVLRDAPHALNIIVEMAAVTSPIVEQRMRKEMGRWKERAFHFATRGW